MTVFESGDEEMLNLLEAEGVAVRAAHDPGALQRVLPLEDFSSDIREAAMSALPAYLARVYRDGFGHGLFTPRRASRFRIS